MESGDILTVAGGLVIVLIIALVANPQYLSGMPFLSHNETQTVTPTPALPATITITVPVITSLPTTEPTPAPIPAPEPPYRIFYTDKPFTYPAYNLPDNLETLGESDIRRAGEEPVTFAYVEDTRGGLTRIFSVPYPVWAMNITVTANRTPQIASFRMALCYAANGTIIDGAVITNPGNAYKKIQTSNTKLYLIISTVSLDQYRIDLETSKEYYLQYGPK